MTSYIKPSTQTETRARTKVQQYVTLDAWGRYDWGINITRKQKILTLAIKDSIHFEVTELTTLQVRHKKLWKLDNITIQPYFTKGWEPLELSLVFNPDPSQLSLVVKITKSILTLSWNNSRQQSNQKEKIHNFNLFATSTIDKKEYQMIVLNCGRLVPHIHLIFPL